jgi:hypothetical protein
LLSAHVHASQRPFGVQMQGLRATYTKLGGTPHRRFEGSDFRTRLTGANRKAMESEGTDFDAGIRWSFPGMPLLTYNIRQRLRKCLPYAVMSLVRDNREVSRQDSDGYRVFVGVEEVGRFTVRTYGQRIERNFFCKLSSDTHLPAGAVVEGSFGVGGLKHVDRCRILAEGVQVVWYWVAQRLVPHRNRSSAMTSTRSDGLYSPTLSLKDMYQQLARRQDTQISLSTAICDVDRKRFSLPSQYVPLLSGNPESFHIDIGGYCRSCQVSLCEKHLIMRAREHSIECALYCQTCGQLVFPSKGCQ